MATIFTRIISGEIPGERILEDERFFACLDIRPINPGHTLVLPKREVENLFDLTEDETEGIWVFARKVARALPKAVECARIGVIVAGFEVPHAHIHLVPISGEGDLRFDRAKPLQKEDLHKIAEKIRKVLD